MFDSKWICQGTRPARAHDVVYVSVRWESGWDQQARSRQLLTELDLSVLFSSIKLMKLQQLYYSNPYSKWQSMATSRRTSIYEVKNSQENMIAWSNGRVERKLQWTQALLTHNYSTSVSLSVYFKEKTIGIEKRTSWC